MITQLTELIRQYEGILRVEDWKKVSYFKLTPFSINLIKMKNFQYKRKEMEELTRFLMDRKIGYYSRFTTLEMVVRRKTMDNLSDIDKRKMIWMMVDKNLDMEDHNEIFAQIFFARYSFEQGKKDLENMIKIYQKKIAPEIEKIKAEVNKSKDMVRREFLQEVGENHMQVTGTLYVWNIPQIIKKAEELTVKHKSAEAQL